MSKPSLNVARFATLARLARDPQTAAIYSAREALAVHYSLRAIIDANGGMLFGRYISAGGARYATARFMSEGSR